MPDCGSQCILCDVPIRYDTYEGCSHGCRYCFVQRKADLTDIKRGESAKALKDFINGKRTQVTKWCDWDIPLHWGGMSDPFQPCEKTMRCSYNALKVFADTKYPFIVSTKGKLITDPEYLELLKECNVVVQISAVCSKYDKLERGCPPFLERVEMARTLAPLVPRVIIRMQPYMHEVRKDVLNSLELVADAGVYGVILEGMKFIKKKPGLIKVGGDYCYPKEVLQQDFEQIRDRAHELGLKFFAGENRLRTMGDSLTCCGCDGLEGFRVNKYNLNHLVNGDVQQPTERMTERQTGICFKTLDQTHAGDMRRKESNFSSEMCRMLKVRRDYVEETFGLK